MNEQFRQELNQYRSYLKEARLKKPEPCSGIFFDPEINFQNSGFLIPGQNVQLNGKK